MKDRVSLHAETLEVMKMIVVLLESMTPQQIERFNAFRGGDDAPFMAQLDQLAAHSRDLMQRLGTPGV